MLEEAVRAIGALLLVLAVILGMSWGLRRFSNMASARRTALSDLKILEWKPVDARRKLAVVRWDGRDHLVSFGPGGDCLIASRDALDPPETPETSAPNAPKLAEPAE